MQDRPVHHPELDFANAPDAPLAAVIACGHVPGNSRNCGVLQTCLPCYQALGPWGEPDAGLPWFRIGREEGLRGPGERTSGDAEPLAVILRRASRLLLLVGNDHDSLALALALATYARSRGIRVTALLAGRPGQTFLQRTALQHCVDDVQECPDGQHPLRVAQALWTRHEGSPPGAAALPDADPGAPPWPGQN